MKKNLPVTDRENTYREDLRLVSTTDLKGIITHANDAFAEVAGFTHEELVGKNHNLVRHPDMPPIAFDDLWQTIKKGQPWMGMVKNRCKSGDYYWVDAFVTPTFENQKVIGYQSVRVKPNRDCVERAEKLYQEVNQGPSLLSRFNNLLPKSLFAKSFLSGTLGAMAAYWIAQSISNDPAIANWVFFGIMLIVMASVSAWLSLPWRQAVERTQRCGGPPGRWGLVHRSRLRQYDGLRREQRSASPQGSGLSGGSSNHAIGVDDRCAGKAERSLFLAGLPEALCGEHRRGRSQADLCLGRRRPKASGRGSAFYLHGNGRSVRWRGRNPRGCGREYLGRSRLGRGRI